MGIQSRPICPGLIHDHSPRLLAADMWRVGQTSRFFEYRRHNCQDSLDEFGFLAWLCAPEREGNGWGGYALIGDYLRVTTIGRSPTLAGGNGTEMEMSVSNSTAV